MSRSPLTYVGALEILGKGEKPLLEKLDKLLGGVILASTAVVGPAGWALLEPKNEAVAVTRSLLDRAKQRALGTSGHSRRELLAAAHTVLVVSAFFDAVAAVLGPGYELLEITDEEKLRLFGNSVSGERRLVDQLLELRIPMPSVTDYWPDNELSLSRVFQRLAVSTIDFITGLAATERVLRGVDNSQLLGLIVTRGQANWWDAYLRFAADVPEFAIWLDWTRDEAIRGAVETAHTETREVLARQSVALSKLHDLLALTAPSQGPAVRSYREQLALANRAVLNEPLLRSGSHGQAGGLSFPTVELGFVTRVRPGHHPPSEQLPRTVPFRTPAHATNGTVRVTQRPQRTVRDTARRRAARRRADPVKRVSPAVRTEPTTQRQDHRWTQVGCRDRAFRDMVGVLNAPFREGARCGWGSRPVRVAVHRFGRTLGLSDPEAGGSEFLPPGHAQRRGRGQLKRMCLALVHLWRR